MVKYRCTSLTNFNKLSVFSDYLIISKPNTTIENA